MADARMIEADPKTVKSWLDKDEALIIDVRETPELIQAHIPGSVHMPLSAFDPGQIPNAGDKKMVFLCAHGIRSVQAGTYLLSQGLVDEAINLTGGMAAWMEFGLPYETGSATTKS